MDPEALRTARTEYERLGLRVTSETLVAQPYVIASIVARSRDCVLRGWGRGMGAEAEARAWNEGLERFWFSRPQTTRSMEIAEVLEQDVLRKDALLLRFAREYPDALVDTVAFEGLSGARLWYPAALRFPATAEVRDTHEYGRYVHRAGTAAAMARPEALLRALLELAEHDALSLAMLEGLRKPGRSSLRQIEPASLPERLEPLFEFVGSLVGCVVALFEVPSDLGVCVVMALPSEEIEFPGAMGLAASLDPSDSLERALSELAQSFCTFQVDLETDANRRRLLQDLRRWPSLLKYADLRSTDLIRCSSREMLPFGLIRTPLDLSGRTPLEALTAHWSAAGHPIYFRVLSPEESQVVVVNAMVPGLERFDLLTLGRPVLPTGRGAALLGDGSSS